MTHKDSFFRMEIGGMFLLNAGQKGGVMKKACKKLRSFRFNGARRAAVDFGPSVALVLAGLPIALDFGQTGRLDLLIGGIFVTLMGLVRADFISGRHLLARGVKRAFPFSGDLHPKLPLALIGLSTTFILFVGESVQLLGRHGPESMSCPQGCALDAVAGDPSSLKILATALFFPLASAMNLPPVHDRLERSLSGVEIKRLQSFCSLIGAALIGVFGLIIGAFSAVFFGSLCGFANLVCFCLHSSPRESA